MAQHGLENPLGEGGLGLYRRAFATRTLVSSPDVAHDTHVSRTVCTAWPSGGRSVE